VLGGANRTSRCSTEEIDLSRDFSNGRPSPLSTD
jgi:hypothetical protein